MNTRKVLSPAAAAALALVAFAASTASATTLEVGAEVQNDTVTLVATLKAGTSTILIDEFGNTADTCTISQFEGKTTAPYSAEIIGGPVEGLTFENCTHKTTVDARGNLSLTWTSGGNGTVRSSGAEVTIQSTFFGAAANCKTGLGGTTIGTFTGSATHATVDINAKVNCGILGNSSWTGTYTVTSPTNLRVTK